MAHHGQLGGALPRMTWKRDPYLPGVAWLKIKNRMYSPREGRGELFHGPR
jgi:hypothetical protein